jgi:hypothetical protein
MTPDVGDIVEYDGTRWRVDSWLLAVPTRNTWMFQRGGFCFRWCDRESADHLSLSGVCGAIVPVSECAVVGRVNWSESGIAEQRDRALRLVGEFVF